MDRPDPGPSDAPTRNPQAQTSESSPQPGPPQQPQTPQAALAAVTRGDNAPPPAPPPKTEAETARIRHLTTSGEYYEDTVSGHGSSPIRDPYRRGSGGVGVPPPPRSIKEGGTYTSGENVMPPGRRRRSGLDWIIPVEPNDKPYVPTQRTAGERIQPTLDHARREKIKYEKKAMLNGYSLNAAIGLQVILGALITGLSAAIKPEKVGITTAILGGLSTIVASFLARMRGSGEPELSLRRTKDLDQFIRECEAFQLDRGYVTGPSEDQTLDDFRKRFEDLLGNLNKNASQDQKQSPI
ncbi:hypothetical protein PILCRDRAFT_814458 [Piloderma croceum F 1598]|uniref:SMODS and SLOG-associating 2TM effector domain-containing protein n=1 Tax=Piloderma croceum (strain F 1598) TaxID=765440 RepID=A0A0C3G7J9_PILCF|nr:hypothetical protein PILCRDRAFT_814458 [Piloderma croceum F 1598]